MILLDSSVLIELFRKSKKEEKLFYKLLELDQDFAISSITNYEVLVLETRLNNGSFGIGNKAKQWKFWNQLSQNLIIIPFDGNISNTAIHVYHQLKKENKLIDFSDVFIGATALNKDI